MPKQFTAQDFKRTLSRPEADWQKQGEVNALKLFHDMARRVPAYKDFLKKNDVTATRVKTIDDLKKLPIVTKKNYLEAYPMEQLYWDGAVDGVHQFSSSSGSTGAPYYWALGDGIERISRWQLDFILRYSFDIEHKSALVVNCFALGTWVAGVLINDIVWDFSRQGYRLSLASPGLNKAEAVRTIQKLAPLYDQVLLFAYGPFAKDIIEESALQGVDWSKFNLGLFSGGESFNESWRDYMAEITEIERRRIVNVYAMIDNGFTGFETDLTMELRRAFAGNPKLGASIYRQERQPSLVQYNPATHFVEEVDGELVFTRDHGVPLVRYNIGDNGGVISYSAARDLLKQSGGKLSANQPQLPLIYVFGRAHHTTTIYGLNVYPENVRAGSEDPRIRHLLSGKTITVTGYSSEMDQQLEIILELAPGAEAPDGEVSNKMREIFVERISQQNSEYNELVRTVGKKAHPLLTFVPHGDPQFMVGAKQTKQAEAKVKEAAGGRSSSRR